MATDKRPKQLKGIEGRVVRQITKKGSAGNQRPMKVNSTGRKGKPKGK